MVSGVSRGGSRPDRVDVVVRGRREAERGAVAWGDRSAQVTGDSRRRPRLDLALRWRCRTLVVVVVGVEVEAHLDLCPAGGSPGDGQLVGGVGDQQHALTCAWAVLAWSDPAVVVGDDDPELIVLAVGGDGSPDLYRSV
jgi:hypothetical protein